MFYYKFFCNYFLSVVEESLTCRPDLNSSAMSIECDESSVLDESSALDLSSSSDNGQLKRALTCANTVIEKAEKALAEVAAEAKADTLSQKLKLKHERAKTKVALAKWKASEARNEQLHAEKEALLLQLKVAENRAKEAEVKTDIVAPLLDLFSTTTGRSKENGSGYSFEVYNSTLDTIILGLLADGHSAISIETFLKMFAKHIVPGVLDYQDGIERTVPCVSYIRTMRSCLPLLNNAQVVHFADEAETITLSADDSPTLDGRPLSSMGCYNESGDYLVFAITENAKKNGIGLAANMTKIIEDSGVNEQIKAKLTTGAIITDASRAQMLGNSLFLTDLEKQLGRRFTTLPCLMHSIKNMETYAVKCLRPETANVLHLCKMLFGSRRKAGFRLNSMKRQFHDLVRSQHITKASVFKTDTGSRYGVDSSNARALVRYQVEVSRVIRNAPDSNKYAADLRRHMESTYWPTVLLECSILSVIYFSCMVPLHNVVSSNTTKFRDSKLEIKLADEKFEEVIEETSKPMELLLRHAEMEDISARTAGIIPVFKELLQEPSLVIHGSDIARRMCLSVRAKLSKDTSSLFTLPIPDDTIVPLTNRSRVLRKGLFSKKIKYNYQQTLF